MKVTISDVAKRTGVSHVTVSNAIRNRPGVGEGTKQKILKVIREMGYIPNEFAQRLRENKPEGLTKQLTYNIGCIVYEGYNFSDSGYHGYSEILDSISSELRKHNYNLQFYYRCDELAKDPLLFNKLINSENVDGLITISTQLEGIFEQVKERIKPIVSLVEPLGNNNGFDCILYDKYQYGYAAVKYLVGLNHKRIGFLGPDFKDAKMRFDGYRKALEDYNLEYDENIVQKEIPFEPQEKIVEAGYEFTKKMLNVSEVRFSGLSIPTAIIAARNPACIGIIEAIKEKGLRVPEDISILGCGEDKEVDLYSKIKITVLRVNRKDVGKLAVERILKRIDNPDIAPVKMLMPYELVEKDSCRVCSKGS